MNAVCTPETCSPAAERVEYLTPAVDIYANEDGYTLEADLPGVGKDGLEIFLDQNTLTLVGRRNQRTPEGAAYRESSGADYRRVFELDPAVDSAGITARIEDGVLTLTLPKAESAKPRQIAVK
jgi:HSP20 family protein